MAKQLEGKYNLPENREQTESVPKEIPPHGQHCHPTIRIELIQETSKNKSDPIDLMVTAQRTIDTYPEDTWIHVYTDGSAKNGTTNAGYGARIQHPDDSLTELHSPCGSLCSNYDAEALAIQMSICHLTSVFSHSTTKVRDTVIFSDSKSVLQALDSDSVTSSTIESLYLTISAFLSTYPINLTLQWIPGHVNIPGNERADTLAKRGASMEQPTKPVPYSTAKSIIQQTSRAKWMKEWTEGKTGRSLHQYMPKPNAKDSVNYLERGEQAIIFWLRSKHAPVNGHLNRIKPTIQPNCPLCRAPNETTDHLLYHCPSLRDLRERYLPPSPDPWNTLYTNIHQLKQTDVPRFSAFNYPKCRHRQVTPTPRFSAHDEGQMKMM